MDLQIDIKNGITMKMAIMPLKNVWNDSEKLKITITYGVFTKSFSIGNNEVKINRSH